MKSLIAAVFALALAAPAAAEVKTSAPDHFLIEHVAEISAPPAAVYRPPGRVGRWWKARTPIPATPRT